MRRQTFYWLINLELFCNLRKFCCLRNQNVFFFQRQNCQSYTFTQLFRRVAILFNCILYTKFLGRINTPWRTPCVDGTVCQVQQAPLCSTNTRMSLMCGVHTLEMEKWTGVIWRLDPVSAPSVLQPSRNSNVLLC